MQAPIALDDEGHAVRRFIERYFDANSTISFEEAERRLHGIRCRATFVEDIDNGQELWEGREEGSVSGVLMVVKDGVVRTVLASWDSNKRRRT